jgi:hypothetical protein
MIDFIKNIVIRGQISKEQFLEESRTVKEN